MEKLNEVLAKVFATPPRVLPPIKYNGVYYELDCLYRTERLTTYHHTVIELLESYVKWVQEVDAKIAKNEPKAAEIS